MTRRPSLAVHLCWELILLLAVLIVVGFAAGREPLFEDGRLLWSVTYLGLLASGLAFSLLLRTPNLAIAGAATLSMVVYGELRFGEAVPPVVAAPLALLAAGVLGVVLAFAAYLFDAPAWAVTLAGLVIPAFFGSFVVAEPFEPTAPGDSSGAVPWLLAFLVISVGGGAWFATSAVGRRLAAEDPGAEKDLELAEELAAAEDLEVEEDLQDEEDVEVAEDLAMGEHRASPPWLRLLVGLTGSSLLGGLAGVVGVLATGEQFPGPWFGTFPMFTGADLVVALGAVLLGGVSIHGDRAGIAGTALATILLSATLAWLGLARAEPPVVWLVIGLALLAGFGLRRAMAAIDPSAEEHGAAIELSQSGPLEDSGSADPHGQALR